MSEEHIVYQLINRDNWQAVEQIDAFMFIYDRMPYRMKLVVDLRLAGNKPQEIASLLKITVSAVNAHLHKAKNRLIKSLF